MLSCDLESIVFLKPSKVQQSENQESKFDNKWLRSRRNRRTIAPESNVMHHPTHEKFLRDYKIDAFLYI